MATLDVRAWLSLAALAVVMALLLFGTAGTIPYGPASCCLVIRCSCSGSDSSDVMATGIRIALVGDYNAAVTAHQAIPQALSLASGAATGTVEWEWVHTASLREDPSDQLAGFDALWCVPASPYANTRGAMGAIRFARRTARPFLGTCGGFQHALLEYAEDVWHVANPAHAELDREAPDPVIAPLTCSLVEQAGEVRFEPGSKLAAMYGVPAALEEYHCRYGLSARYADRLSAGPLHVSARDAEGEVRAVELDGHPFFVATLFQPERAALSGRIHPVIGAFVDATLADRRGVRPAATGPVRQ